MSSVPPRPSQPPTGEPDGNDRSASAPPPPPPPGIGPPPPPPKNTPPTSSGGDSGEKRPPRPFIQSPQPAQRPPQQGQSAAFPPPGGQPSQPDPSWAPPRQPASGAPAAAAPAPQQEPPQQKKKGRAALTAAVIVACVLVIAAVVALVILKPWRKNVEAENTPAPAESSESASPSESPKTGEERISELTEHGTEAAKNGLDGAWVAELSAKKPGIEADGITYTWDDMVDDYERNEQLADSFGYDVLMTKTDDWATFKHDGLWVTVVDYDFGSAEDALDFCRQAQRDRDNCNAKQLSTSGDPEGTVKYLDD